MNYSQYDDIASKYDTLFRDETSLVENREVGEMLPPLTGMTLDIGCGTGLLTEISNVSSKHYLGIDPSNGMLEQFKKKRPEFKRSLICEPFDGKVLGRYSFKNIISLFGSPSYLSENAILSISNSAARKFLMFYKEEYHPITYEMCKVEFKHFCYSKDFLCNLFGKNNVLEYHNYLIVKCV